MLLQAVLSVLLISSASLAFKDPHLMYDREQIVHLFEWKWSDIARECEEYLAPLGYGAVQISPPSDHHVVWDPWRPWWERYQPVCYNFISRSGDRDAFEDMVKRCNDVGVLIYVDLVINHMTGDTVGPGYGIGGCPCDAANRHFPGVPYSYLDFNDDKCDSNIGNYQNAEEVRNCRLVGLVDLDQGNSWVREKIVEYMNDAISMGVAGFRVDACKHMWPEDLEIIYNGADYLDTRWFDPNTKPFIVQEVIDYGGEAVSADEYTGLARVTEFKYGSELSNCFKGNNQLQWLRTWGEAWGLMSRFDALAFIDNHDTQRDHGGILTYKQPREYKMAVEFMLAHDYGLPRVMSSYDFDHRDQSPPAWSDGTTKDVDCTSSEWICEHRWRQIYNMAWFRNVAKGTGVDNWWDNKSNQIAFSRGDKAFIAINGDSWTLNASVYTGLSAGTYCNLIVSEFDTATATCTKIESHGTPGTVTVNSSGYATLSIPVTADPVVAIHVDAKL